MHIEHVPDSILPRRLVSSGQSWSCRSLSGQLAIRAQTEAAHLMITWCLIQAQSNMRLLDAHMLLRTICLNLQATWQNGWDVVTPADVEISSTLQQLLHAQPGSKDHVGQACGLQRGQVLQQKDQACRQFYILLTVSRLGVPCLGVSDACPCCKA